MPIVGYATKSWTDYDGESANVSVRIPVITAANYDAIHTKIVALWGAVSNITLGRPYKNEEGNRYITASRVAADDYEAQRESKWLVAYRDTTTFKMYSMELPCADRSKLDPEDRAHAMIGDAAEVDAFITAFEALVLSQDGNAVEVTEITHVGRNI